MYVSLHRNFTVTHVRYETFIYNCGHGTSILCLRPKQENKYERTESNAYPRMGQNVPIE